ncbi:hypothetical protein SVAN01_06680 [Stagonosporopsis vannaccii]|nr:hypothetical protein SVAN01_06680 [Stagonosporopsis vannaccii]
MWPTAPITAIKATKEQFVHCVQKYFTTTVDHKAEKECKECIICTQQLCDIDGCTIDEHEEPVRLPCGHVIGTRQVLYEVPESHFF